MRVAILSARKGWHTDQLCRAISARGATPHLLAYESLVAHLGSSGPSGAAATGPFAIAADVVLARIIPSGSLEQIIYRVDALHWLEDTGVRVINSPRAIERSVDKFYTSALLRDGGARDSGHGRLRAQRGCRSRRSAPWAT